MANAVAVPTVTKTWTDGTMFHAIGTIAVSASPATYVTNGIACSFAKSKIKATRVPQQVTFTSLNGYEYFYVNGTKVSDGLLKISTTATSEITGASAIPATVSGDTIQFHAIWLGQN